MSKSDTELYKIDMDRCYGSPNQPQFTENRAINGFDTETADGTIFALSYAWEGDAGKVLHNDGKALRSEQLWDIMTHHRARSSVNVWYNLNFDANVFLSHVLDETEMAILSLKGQIEVENPDYEVSFIPGKFLLIKDSAGHSWYHFDASQFFYTSLEDACSEWLGRGKENEGIDTSRFGKPSEDAPAHLEQYDVNGYILDNWFDIIKYARVDAELVRDLWREAVTQGEALSIPMGRPFSTGYLAESYLNNRFDEKPGLGPREVQQMAWDSYHGGRFEVLKRGDIGEVAGPDINSAYPYILRDLPNPGTMHWERLENPDIDDLRDGELGFVRATVSTDESRAIQPFAHKGADDVLKYPALKDTEKTVVRELFTFAYDEGYLEDYEIHEAWIGKTHANTEYPFSFIDGLYSKRKEFEANGKEKKAQLLKIVLNSMYGKTVQTTPQREEVEGTIEFDEDDQREYVSHVQLPESLQDEWENGLTEVLQAGAYFNPVLASYITGLTRLELHKRVCEYGLEDNTVMMATDSLMIEKDAFEESGFADDLVKPGLGNWDYDYRGEAFVIAAGVYEVRMNQDPAEFETFEKLRSSVTKTMTRGFAEADLDGTLRSEAIKAGDEKINIMCIRPRTMAEIVWDGGKASDIGKFVQMDRKLSPDMDNKRHWPETTSFNDLLGIKQDSRPIVVQSND